MYKFWKEKYKPYCFQHWCCCWCCCFCHWCYCYCCLRCRLSVGRSYLLILTSSLFYFFYAGWFANRFHFFAKDEFPFVCSVSNTMVALETCRRHDTIIWSVCHWHFILILLENVLPKHRGLGNCCTANATVKLNIKMLMIRLTLYSILWRCTTPGLEVNV